MLIYSQEVGSMVKELVLSSPSPTEPLSSQVDELSHLQQFDLQLQNVLESTSEIDPVRIYFLDLSRTPLLTRSQEQDLGKIIEIGRKAQRVVVGSEYEFYKIRIDIWNGWQAEKRLVEHNLRLVIPIAIRHKTRGLDLLDLCQEGNRGLQKAAEKFDWRKGVKFATYATPWVNKYIKLAIANQSRLIRFPVYFHNEKSQVWNAYSHLVAAYGEIPTDTDIAQITHLELTRVRDILFHGGVSTTSLSTPVGKERDRDLETFIEADETSVSDIVETKLLYEYMVNAITKLPSKQRRVMILRRIARNGEGLTLEAIGEIMEITREWVRRIEKKAIQNLRYYYENGTFPEDLIAGEL